MKGTILSAKKEKLADFDIVMVCKFFPYDD